MRLAHPRRRGMADAQHAADVWDLAWLSLGALKSVEELVAATEVGYGSYDESPQNVPFE